MRRLILKSPQRFFGGRKGLPNMEADDYQNHELVEEFNHRDSDIKKTFIKTLYQTATKYGLRGPAQFV